MQRDGALVLDMLMTARRVQAKLEVDRRTFNADDNLQLAVVHLIQVIGEAARGISSEFRDAHPELDWSGIVGMRHRIVHDYLHINLDVVWDTATNDIPALVALLDPLVAPPDADSAEGE